MTTTTRKLDLLAFIMSGLLMAGCAGTVQDRALRAGMIAREVVDTGAETLRAHLTERATACRNYVERAKFDACLGPVARNPAAVTTALEGIRSAQVGLWLALASGEAEQMKSAQGKLMAALGQLARLVRRAKEVKQ